MSSEAEDKHKEQLNTVYITSLFSASPPKPNFVTQAVYSLKSLRISSERLRIGK